MTFEIPLRKIDEERRLVIGQAAAECLDKSGESMDYASAKAAFQKWSDEFNVSTNGLSKGNLRVMHTKEVAGKLIDISFDDATKAVNVVAHVASDNAWNLVKSGCFSGFSIGGGYAARWTDDKGLRKYTPKITEISLVDSPCIPTAMFAELIKADGMVEVVPLVGKIRTFADAWAERPAPVPTFADAWAGRPQTFAELHKAAPKRRTPSRRAAPLSEVPEVVRTSPDAKFNKPSNNGLGPKQRNTYRAARGVHVAPPGAEFDETKHARDHGRFAARAGMVGRGAGKLFGGLSFGAKLRVASLPLALGSAALTPFSMYRNHQEEDGREAGPISARAGGWRDNLRSAAAGVGVASGVADLTSGLADSLRNKATAAASGAQKLLGTTNITPRLRHLGENPTSLKLASKGARYGLPVAAGLVAAAVSQWSNADDARDRAKAGKKARESRAANTQTKASSSDMGTP